MVISTPLTSETPDDFNFESTQGDGDYDPETPYGDENDEEEKKDNILSKSQIQKPRSISNNVGNIRTNNERFLILFE